MKYVVAFACLTVVVNPGMAPEAGGTFDAAKYNLYPPDTEFKARWEKVKDKYIPSWRAKEADPKEQAAFLAAWETGSPITRAMLTEVLMKLEGTARQDTPLAVLGFAGRLDADWPRLTDDLKARAFESVAASRKSHKGLRDWGHMASHVEAAAMACEYPKGFEPRERPFVWTTRAELPELKKRLEKDPWKTWYGLVVKISDAALAGKDGSEDEELRLRFPSGIWGKARTTTHLPNAIECLALRYWVEGKKE